MSIELNHTIVASRDKKEGSTFLASLFGRPEPVPFGPFLEVEVDNGVTLAFMDTDGEVVGQHYAFLVSEDAFDEIFGRIQERGLTYWPDPGRSTENQINTRDGGRGCYFEDPSGHFLEILTRPYGH